MLLVDTVAGRIISDDEIKTELAESDRGVNGLTITN
jgi:hypothetical protein